MTPEGSDDRRTTRRQFTVGGIGTLVSVPFLLAACGDDSEEGAASGSGDEKPAGPWEFTDDVGVQVSLPERPQTIVAWEDAAAALYHLGVTISAIFGGAPLKGNPALYEMDLTGIESVGEVYAEINLEKLVGMRPDLIVGTTTTTFEGWPGFGFADDAHRKRVEEIAPVVLIDIAGERDMLGTLGRFEELAAGLGADLEAAGIPEAKTRVEAGRKALRNAASANPGVSVVALGPSPNMIEIAVVDDHPDLRDYRQLGVEMVSGEGKDPIWENVGWENVGKYPADLILHSSQHYHLQPDDLGDRSTWTALPAVRAGQLAPWLTATATLTYDRFAGQLETLAEAVEQADAAVVA